MRDDSTISERWLWRVVIVAVAVIVVAALWLVAPVPQPAAPPAPVFETGQDWPQVTRCSVVMPEDLDQVDGSTP